MHIAAALGLFGASVVLLIGGLRAATREDPGEAHAIYELLRLLTFSVDIPLAVIALLAGLTLALTLKQRIYRYWWVMGKLALYAATVTVGVAIIGPSIDTMLEVTEVDSPAESSTRWRLVALTGAQIAMVLSAAVLGVFKPGQARAARAHPSHAGDREPARARLSTDETETDTG